MSTLLDDGRRHANDARSRPGQRAGHDQMALGAKGKPLGAPTVAEVQRLHGLFGRRRATPAERQWCDPLTSG